MIYFIVNSKTYIWNGNLVNTMLHYTDKTYNFQFFQEIWKKSIFRIVFLKIEIGNPYKWFIHSCDNLYYLKFLNENMLKMHQY